MPREIKISFAQIDVRGDRAGLTRRVKDGEKVHFSMSGHFIEAGNDDGISRVFEAAITDFAVEGEKG